MAKDEETKQANAGEHQTEEKLHGRIHNSQNPEFEQGGAGHDISSVDQQEGTMNNGETGGSFSSGKEA